MANTFGPYDQAAFAQYTPLSSQEILQPAMLMRERHDKMDEEYAAIDDELQKVAFIVQNENDPNIKSQYQNYMNSLASNRDALMESGVNSNTKRNMLNLRSRYQSEIQPINLGYQMKSQDINRYNDMIAKDPTYIGQDPTQRSVSDYISNGLQPFTQQGISGSLITKMASDFLSPFSRELSKELNGTELNDLVSDLLYKADGTEQEVATMREYIKKHGYKPETKGHDALMQIASKAIMKSTGVDNWADENQLSQIQGYINQAASQTIGQEQSQFINTEGNLIRRQAQQDKLAAKNASQSLNSNPLILPTVERGVTSIDNDTLDKSFKGDFKRENEFLETLTTLPDGSVSDGETQKLETEASELEEKAASYYQTHSNKIPYKDGYPKTPKDIDKKRSSSKIDKNIPFKERLENKLDTYKNNPVKLATYEQRQYDKLLDKAKSVRGRVSENLDRNSKFVEKYSHLSTDPAEAIYLGYMYDKARRVRTDNVMAMQPSSQSIITENILDWSEVDKNSGLYELKKDGSMSKSPMDKDSIRKLKINKDKITIQPILSKNGIELQVGDKTYAVKTNRSDVIQSNELMSKGSNYLTDYSTPEKETIGDIQSMQIESILKSPNKQVLVNNNSFAVVGETFRLPDGDLQKILLIKPKGGNWRMVSSSLYDEIQGGSLSSQGINLLGGIVATGFSNTNNPNKNQSSSYTEKTPQTYPE